MEKLGATCKVFRSAYMCAKEEIAFVKHSAIMELHELNGCTKASMLYSHHSCANILKHIAQEMKTELNNYIKASVHPFSIMIDETTTLSTKSVLVIFIRIQVDDDVCNFFYDFPYGTGIYGTYMQHIWTYMVNICHIFPHICSIYVNIYELYFIYVSIHDYLYEDYVKYMYIYAIYLHL